MRGHEKRPPRYRAAFSIRRLAILRSARRVGAGGRVRHKPTRIKKIKELFQWASVDFRPSVVFIQRLWGMAGPLIRCRYQSPSSSRLAMAKILMLLIFDYGYTR